MCSWEDTCYGCSQKRHLQEIKEQLLSSEIDETSCESEIICPYCGEVNDYDCDYYDDIYTEGDKVMRCNCCEKEFNLCVNVSYSYDTSRLDEEETQ